MRISEPYGLVIQRPASGWRNHRRASPAPELLEEPAGGGAPLFLVLAATARGPVGPDPLERGAEHELARVQDERRLSGNLDELGQLGLFLCHVDEGIPVVPEDPE